MSSFDPISPTSPMTISPISPNEMHYFDTPEQPTLSPVVHLPRLMTSFQNMGSHLKRMSMQFQLPTPSPLSLNSMKSPITAIPRRASTPIHRRSHATCIKPLDIELLSDSNSTAFPDPNSPHPHLATSATSSHRRIPSFQRQNAMEGLEIMTSPINEQVISLPLRTTRRPSEAARQTSYTTQALAEDALTTTFPSTSRTLLRRKHRRHSSSTTSSSRIRPRSPIQKLHRRSHSYSSAQIQAQRPYFEGLITHLRNELIPLVDIRNGTAHPAFPTTLLQYNLLTHDQLDDLARHYHQTTDAGEERWQYPCPIGWGKVWCGSVRMQDEEREDAIRRRLVDLTTKRRRWGRFIGLRNCESPTADDIEANAREMDESIRERMEEEWQRGLKKQEEEYRVREKMMRGNF